MTDTSVSASSPAVAAQATAPYPNVRYAWYVATLLLAVYILSYVDRYILSLLIEPIKTSLRLTDFQIGLLIGPAFVILFVTVGLPIGWLVDRKSRRVILSTGIAVWSVMTAACGLANSFVALFLVRIGVGIGETTAAPCAFSLFGDYFPKNIRPRAVALFMLGAPAGAGVTYIIGGQLFEMITAAPPVVLPIVGELFAWQTAFLIVGLPGLLVAALVWFTVREPKRQEMLSKRAGGPTLGEAVGYMWKHKASYGAVFGGIIGVTAIGAASFWIPALYERNWGWGVGQSGIYVGVILIVSGILGTQSAGWIASKLIARGVHHAPYYTVFGGALMMIPFSILYPLMPTPETATVMIFFFFLGMSIASGTSPSCIIAITPGELRGQATVVFFFTINLFGSLVAPPLVGIIADGMGGPGNLKYGLAYLGAGFSVLMALSLWLGFKSFKQSAAELAAASDSGAG
ncbi:MAG: MFS transporter [Rhodospirillaceae bacterium]|jgi:MFS family permease|nr:MFS transporter [Rhodospirillaceae bacterium]